MFKVAEGFQRVAFKPAFGKIITHRAAGAEGHAIGRARTGYDASGVDLAKVSERNDFVEEVKIFTSLAFVHSTLPHISVSADGHAGTNGVEGVRETSEAERLDIVAQVEFVNDYGFVDFWGAAGRVKKAFERVLEVDATTRAFWIGTEVGFNLNEIAWIALRVGIEADDGSLQPMELIETVQGFIHANLAGESYSRVPAGQVRRMEEMDAEIMIAIFACPSFGLGQCAVVLLDDFGWSGFRRVEHNNDFDCRFRTLGAPK